MEALDVRLEGDGAFADKPIRGKPLSRIDRIAVLPRGTNHGNPSVAIGVELPDGSYVVAETTLRLLQTAMRGIEARYGVVE